ncbi:hypothetical protein Micbo1qcDRAFT_156806 [Microdochium bolleyi]|uniref:Uncharacterized protein n=1 Tax=Microdochium bolleyi TaxID=196109 RepID=A0A136JCZ8_9PEZI|nr:hypothetical protein Micbo1qcDRAFT_156806 [Microdochium bolleyi]
MCPMKVELPSFSSPVICQEYARLRLQLLPCPIRLRRCEFTSLSDQEVLYRV